MLKQVETKILIEELKTDGHGPMKFICSDGSVYFSKYRSGRSFKENELHCLIFEVLCTRLLQSLGLPVPDQALVFVNENSIAPGQLQINKRYIRHGVIGWGSKEIPGADLVKEIEKVQSKTQFNRLLNPDDLIRIAIFDLWVDNADRHSENYNLLLKLTDGKLQLITIDHAFTFGGLKGMDIFHEKTLPDVYKKLIQSNYFRSIVSHISNKQRIEIANQFLSLIAKIDIQAIINEVFKDIPAQWLVNKTLKERLTNFLQSRYRQQVLKEICHRELEKNLRGVKTKNSKK